MVLHAPEIDPVAVDGKRLNIAVAVAGEAHGTFGKAHHLVPVGAGNGIAVLAPGHHRMGAPGIGQADVTGKAVLAPVRRGRRRPAKDRGGELHAVAGPDGRKPGGESGAHHSRQRGGAFIIGVPFHRRAGKGDAVKV